MEVLPVGAVDCDWDNKATLGSNGAYTVGTTVTVTKSGGSS